MSSSPERAAHPNGLLLHSRWILAADGAALRGGGLWVVRGRIARLLRTPAELRAFRRRTAARPLDLGAALVAPGFVDAHAHLELSALRGRVRPGASFAAWIAALLVERGRCAQA